MCSNFTLTYPGAQLYAAAYAPFDPTNVATGYLGDVGDVLSSPDALVVRARVRRRMDARRRTARHTALASGRGCGIISNTLDEPQGESSVGLPALQRHDGMDDGDDRIGSTRVVETYFAPPARESAETLAKQVALLVDHPVIRTVLESFCGQVLVLNQHRQILAASPEFRDALAAYGVHDFVGQRPGEAFGCEHSSEGPGGCGTSMACRHCGAVLAILMAQCCLGPTSEECWITMRRKNKLESVEYRAKATRLRLEGTDNPEPEGDYLNF